MSVEKKPMTIFHLMEIQRVVGEGLNKIHKSVCDANSKITCIIRHPDFDDGYLIVTDDSLGELKNVIDRALDKPGFGEVPPPTEEPV